MDTPGLDEFLAIDISNPENFPAINTLQKRITQTLAEIGDEGATDVIRTGKVVAALSFAVIDLEVQLREQEANLSNYHAELINLHAHVLDLERRILNAGVPLAEL